MALKTIIKIVFLLLFSLFFKNAISQSVSDSLLKELSIAQEDTSKVNLLNNLAYELRTADKEKALSYAKQAAKLAEKLDFKRGMADAYRNIGTIYYVNADYENALKNYEKGLEISQQIHDNTGSIKAYNNLGNIFYVQGNYNKALEHYFLSLKLSDEINDQAGTAKSHSAIGLVYYSQENYKEALKNFTQSLKISEKLGDKSSLATTTYYIGVINQDQKKFDEALNYFKKSLEISLEINKDRQVATCYESIGTIYLEKKEYDNVLPYYEKSLVLRKKMNNKLGIANVLTSFGTYYTAVKDYPKAIKFLEESMSMSKELGLLSNIKAIAGNLSVAYSKMSNYKKAFENQVLFKTMSDSLRNEENTKKITELGMQYEFDKQKKLNIIEQQKKDAIQVAELKRQKSFRNFLLLGIGLIFLFAIFLYRSNQFKQKANALLSAQNIEIQRNSESLKLANHEIMRKSQQITDSINYASRIQTAILPPEEFFKDNFSDYFILFKPRNIVSGDYYWFLKKNKKLIVAVADCTGHGVPGAFLSMLGISFLYEIVNKHANITTGKILDTLREYIKESLRQTGDVSEPKDGMDIALCEIDLEQMILNYSGAHNPLVIYKAATHEIEEYNADRMPIAIYRKEKPFETQSIKIESGDCIYLFSDGYADQIGGEKNHKFMRRRLRELFLTMNLEKQEMQNQKQTLDNEFYNWKLKNEQVDDVLVMGIRV